MLNVKKIEKVLAKEELIAGALAEMVCKIDPEVTADEMHPCDHVGHCAVGALLAAAGMSDKRLLRGSVAEHSLKTKAGKLLRDAYGIMPPVTAAIERINDYESLGDSHGDKDGARFQSVMGLVAFLQMLESQGIDLAKSGALEEVYKYEDDWFEIVDIQGKSLADPEPEDNDYSGF